MSKQETKNNIIILLKSAKLKFAKSLWKYLFRKSGSIMMTLFVVISIVSGFLIYKYIYFSGWSNAKKNEYLKESSTNNANFSIERFEKIIENIKERNKNYKKTNLLDAKNIFRF